MTRTGLEVITDALRLLGIVAGHEVPTAADTQAAFARLNELIDSWGTHAHTMALSAREEVDLLPGVQEYTIGAGATVDAPRPMALDAVSYLTSPGTDVEVFLEVGDDAAYIGLPMKTALGSPPTTVVYTPSVPYGTLWVAPIPTTATTLVVYYHLPVAEFPDLVTPVALAPGYARALRTNLAFELAPEYGRTLDPVIVAQARESLADVKRQNWTQSELTLSGVPGVCGGRYTMATDT